MKQVVIILILSFTGLFSLSGQKFDFGIQYSPIQLSRISFDQNYVIFDDYSSLKIYKPKFRISAPSISNSGVFLRYKAHHAAFQTGLNFQNNVYFYSKRIYDYTISSVSIYYSSIDIPLTLTYTLRHEEKVKYRITAGVNNKIFKIRRNNYSIFSKSLDYMNYVDATTADTERRKFMIDKIKPFILYFRSGIGFELYNFTADIYLDRNLTEMNRYIDKNNANYIDTYQINLALGFSIAPKDLKYKKFKEKINKE
jgi:hypothetical protein